MAKKPPAVYEHGELDKVRSRLGEIDPMEARRIAEKLGGEVGVEKSAQERRFRAREETVDLSVGGRGPARAIPARRVETIHEDADRGPRKERSAKVDPEDDPSVPLKPTYRERLKMDRYAAQVEFEVKNPTQVIYSMLALFGDPSDFVNPDFVTRRMNEYYTRIETLVASTRTLLPRNNLQRNEKLRRESAFHFSILDTIRYWNIERIASELAHIQARPRNARVADFIEILKAIYRPLYILEKLDPEAHIKEAYKALYKILLLENPVEAKERHQGLVRAALASYSVTSRSIRFYLYPLLLKTLSDRWLPYEDFFDARKNRLASFLGVSEKNRLSPPPPGVEETAAERHTADRPQSAPEKAEERLEADAAAPETEQVEEPKKRALMRGLETLESLFPKAGWNRLREYPDLYPYFAGVFDLKKGYELISPDDPMQQVAILMRILEELFYALRYVAFGTAVGPDGSAERADEIINRIIAGWHDFIEGVLEKQYLPRLGEYCRILDGAPESRTSTYAKRTLMELHWLKRLYFLPYYRFESVSAPPFRRQDVTPIYTEVRNLRRLLTAVASGIEKGTKLGGAEKKLPCDGIDNPWDPYVFQVPNPLSVRLDALLGGKGSKRKTNAALVFYTLAVTTVLDQLINDESSWAYGDDTGPLFRSVDGEGIAPLFGVDDRVDAEYLFKESLKHRA